MKAVKRFTQTSKYHGLKRTYLNQLGEFTHITFCGCYIDKSEAQIYEGKIDDITCKRCLVTVMYRNE